MTPLLLVPGLNTTGRIWQPVMAALPPGLPCIAVDCSALDTVEAIAEQLLAAAPPRFALAGYSFGGYVALAMLEQAPERIEKLALVATNSHTDSRGLRSFREASIARTLAGEHMALLREQVAITLHPENRDRSDLLEHFFEIARDYGAARHVAHLKACMARPDRGARLAACGKPVLIVTGDADALMPLERQHQMAAAVPGARLVIVPGAGHMIALERPRELAAALAAWAAPSP
jgi:pimeloyl-ACP methyl ester carboxylesterase